MVTRQRQILLFGTLLLALLAAYSNHFGNSFHFDDQHAILDNPAIRTPANIPGFFRDARTFSHDPAGQSYRPLVSTSLALDYWLGGGLQPFWFHVSTFVWFVVQVVLMYALYLFVLERTRPDPRNIWIAWFAAAVYALHPVSAETLNYIIQRGDLYVALGIVAGLVLYASKPTWRRYGLYLLPPLAAMFAKPPALVFALFLLAYVVLIDRASPLRAIPAFVLSAAFLLLEKVMTPPTFFHTSITSFDYWITQPYVALRYFRSFFLPLYLNVDTDLPALHSLASPLVLAGLLFCSLLIAAAVITARRPEWRAVSFGLWWFLIGLIPTAVYPLNEVENDRRMFLPFIGLSLAVIATAAILLRRYAGASTRRFAAAGGLILLALAWGTYGRNEVWRTDEGLWRDDIQKSPMNARGHDHLGHALTELPDRTPEQMQEAIREFEAALRIDPDFVNAHYNLGVAFSKLPGHLPEAISEWRTALRINPNVASAHYNLGVALSQIPGHTAEVISEYQAELRLQPGFATAHLNLAIVLAGIPGRLPEAIAEYQAALRITPDDATAHYGLGAALSKMPGRLPEAIAEYQAALRIEPSYADAHTALGLALAQIPERMPEAISEFQTVAKLRPASAEAHSNLALALLRAPGRLPEAISEFEVAFRIRPDPALRQTLDNLRANR